MNQLMSKCSDCAENKQLHENLRAKDQYIYSLKQQQAKGDKCYNYKEWPHQTHLRARTKAEHLEQIKCLLGEEMEKLSWIPVSERLPKNDDVVDVIAKIERTSGQKSIKRICDIRWEHAKVAYPDSYTFTHYRPIILPGKEG